ncbi:MAG: hypothetical protein WC523_00770 [Patescibacteria group bacterium]
MKLSLRHNAGIETPSGGGSIGISTKVRKYWREYYKSVPGMLGPNDSINYLIAMDYNSATPLHRFILRSEEPAEIRKSHEFVYIAVIRKTGRHDIIVIQKSFKEAPDTTKKQRMTQEWLDKVFRGEIKRRTK